LEILNFGFGFPSIRDFLLFIGASFLCEEARRHRLRLRRRSPSKLWTCPAKQPSWRGDVVPKQLLNSSNFKADVPKLNHLNLAIRVCFIGKFAESINKSDELSMGQVDLSALPRLPAFPTSPKLT